MGDQPKLGDITEVLARHGGRGPEMVDELLPLVFADLHRLARNLMRRERVDHTLQPGALVSELYLKLRESQLPGLPNRGAFFGMAHRAMRQLLIDHARGKDSGKRSPGAALLAEAHIPAASDQEGLAQLDEIFAQLRRMSARQARVAELRVLAGYTHEEIAQELNTSTRTIEREWRVIRAWLGAQLGHRGQA